MRYYIELVRRHEITISHGRRTEYTYETYPYGRQVGLTAKQVANQMLERYGKDPDARIVIWNGSKCMKVAKGFERES